LPNPRTQRLVTWIAIVGVLASCAGCTLIWQNQVTAAVIVLVLADLALIPLFAFLLRTRRRLKRVVARQEEEKEAQLEALADVNDLLVTKVASGDAERPQFARSDRQDKRDLL
jgi:ABC-type bacteriocin/lantibiotic exporter with double-glycine peptidase domain